MLSSLSPDYFHMLSGVTAGKVLEEITPIEIDDNLREVH